MPKFIPVESSNIEAVMYVMNESTRTGALFVQFKGKKPVTYRYEAVPQELVTEFLDADSKGAFLNKSIAPKYVNTKLPENWSMNDDGTVGIVPTAKGEEYDDHGILIQREVKQVHVAKDGTAKVRTQTIRTGNIEL